MNQTQYNRWRYFSPELGRYISADPLGQVGGFNLYRYVSNQPTTTADPLGLFQVSPQFAARYPNVAAQVNSANTRSANSSSNYQHWTATTGASGAAVNSAFTPGQGPVVNFGQVPGGVSQLNANGSITLDQDLLDRLQAQLLGPDPGFTSNPQAGICMPNQPQGPSPSAVAAAQSALDFALSHELAHLLRVATGREPPVGSQNPVRAAVTNINSDIQINNNLIRPIFGRTHP